MAHKLYSVSVPGSLMLFGEHAVLAGSPAIVCAVNKRLRVTLIPDDSNIIKISDTKLGSIQQGLADLKIVAPFQFVLSAISLFKDQINTGFSLNINADFSSVMGLGSSAAVTAATIAILTEWLEAKRLSAQQVFLLAKQAVLQVQKVGSGADLAASIFGGVLGYQIEPLEFIPLPIIPNLTAVYCGSKKPTSEVINIVTQAKQQQPQLFESIFATMRICVLQAIAAIRSADWPALGQLFVQHQGLQSALGTSNLLLDSLIGQLRARKEILGAKISGSGLGDCVIGLGQLNEQVFPIDNMQQQLGVVQIPIQIDQEGILYDY